MVDVSGHLEFMTGLCAAIAAVSLELHLRPLEAGGVVCTDFWADEGLAFAEDVLRTISSVIVPETTSQLCEKPHRANVLEELAKAVREIAVTNSNRQVPAAYFHIKSFYRAKQRLEFPSLRWHIHDLHGRQTTLHC
jgi:hypothetical protein